MKSLLDLSKALLPLFLFSTPYLSGSCAFEYYQANIAMSELFFDLSRNQNHQPADDFPLYFEEGSFAVILAKNGRVLKGKYLWRNPARTFNKFIPYDFSVPESFSFLSSTAAESEPIPEGQKFIPLPEAPPVKNNP